MTYYGNVPWNFYSIPNAPSGYPSNIPNAQMTNSGLFMTYTGGYPQEAMQYSQTVNFPQLFTSYQPPAENVEQAVITEPQKSLPQEQVVEIDRSLYLFHEPMILPPRVRQPKTLVFGKDDSEVTKKRLADIPSAVIKPAKPPPVRVVEVDLVDCSSCREKKPDSTLVCPNGHKSCIDCCAKRYIGGDVDCKECGNPWTMRQILHAHFIICGESMQELMRKRPAEIQMPKDGCICLGTNEFISERIEEDKPIKFPPKGHLTYNKNIAVEACPNGHVICKRCATRIVEDGNKNCPVCNSKLIFELPPDACAAKK